MFRRPIKEINAEFPAEESYLDSIQQIVREACATSGMRRKHISAVLLAIEEGATNIIRHAYLYEKGTIRIRIVIYSKTILFSLFDTGRSFTPDSSGKLDLNKLVETGRRGGLGFYMVQKIMDSVEYISSAGFNELRMSRRIQSDPRKGPGFLRRMFSLRVKFSFWTLFIVSIIVIAVNYYENNVTVKQLYDHLDETASALTSTIAEQTAGFIINRRSDVEFDQLTYSFSRSNPFISLIVMTDTENNVLAHSLDETQIRKPYVPPFPVPSGPPGTVRAISSADKNLRYLMMPISQGTRKLGTVHVLFTTDLIDKHLEDARIRSIALTTALLLVGIIGIFLLTSYFVTPIVNITRRVRKFSSGEMEGELPLDGAEEFLEISRALNEMTTRLSNDRQNLIEKERLSKEIEVASQIQKTLLPNKLPHPGNLEVEAFYRAASMVGGDLYDMFEVSEGRYCMVVADVSGKGVPASLVMSMLRTVIQIHACNSETARETLLKVNDYLIDNIPPGMFITLLLAILDVATDKVKLVSAGHNPLLHYHNGTGQFSEINPPGMPLGVPVTLDRTFEESVQEIELELEPGDLILLYTDGITEATNHDGEQFGVKRLKALIHDHLQSSTERKIAELSRIIIEEVDGHAGFGRQDDDITFLMVRTAIETESNDSKVEESPSISVQIVDEDKPTETE